MERRSMRGVAMAGEEREAIPSPLVFGKKQRATANTALFIKTVSQESGGGGGAKNSSHKQTIAGGLVVLSYMIFLFCRAYLLHLFLALKESISLSAR
jgi:hypothetical protein